MWILASETMSQSKPFFLEVVILGVCHSDKQSDKHTMVIK